MNFWASCNLVGHRRDYRVTKNPFIQKRGIKAVSSPYFGMRDTKATLILSKPMLGFSKLLGSLSKG
jgi:hypothetical protein